jgi:hypothetical protein
LIVSGCAKYTYNFDVARDETSLIGRGFTTRAVEPIENAPFCQFDKYEITIYFVHIVFYEVRGNGYSRHTVVNRDIDNGIKIDLAHEKLSDKIPTDDLCVMKAEGDAIDKIYIGIGDVLTVNGYIYRNGLLCHTTSSGVVAGDGTPEDFALPVVGSSLIPQWEFSNKPPDVPPIIGDLHGIYLLLAYGGNVVGNDHIRIHDLGTIEVRFPIDIGVVYYGQWQSCDVQVGTPFIEGSTVYEKYYLKRAGEPRYTDMIRFLFDRKGHLINGQCWGYPFDIGSGAKNVFSSPVNIWLASATLDMYNQAFGLNSDGSIRFDSRVGYGRGQVYAPAFVRGSHTGQMSVNGKTVSYECIKVE